MCKLAKEEIKDAVETAKYDLEGERIMRKEELKVNDGNLFVLWFKNNLIECFTDMKNIEDFSIGDQVFDMNEYKLRKCSIKININSQIVHVDDVAPAFKFNAKYLAEDCATNTIGMSSQNNVVTAETMFVSSKEIDNSVVINFYVYAYEAEQLFKMYQHIKQDITQDGE